MNNTERFRNVVDFAKDPKRWKSVAKTGGNIAIRGALGKDGLNVIKTTRHGEQKIRKIGLVKETAKAGMSPANAGRKVVEGVVAAARHEVRSRAAIAAREAIHKAAHRHDTIAPEASQPSASSELAEIIPINGNSEESREAQPQPPHQQLPPPPPSTGGTPQ